MLKRDPWTPSDYEDLRDILREYNGEKTDYVRLEKLLKNQVWQGREIQSPISAVVINHLTSLIANSPTPQPLKGKHRSSDTTFC